MKKIVALVLTLAMVMGLATTAMAEVKYTDYDYDLHLANALGSTVVEDVAYAVIPAIVDESTGTGAVPYYVVTDKAANDYYFVEVAKADATTDDYYLTKANDKAAIVYLVEIASPADAAYDYVATEITDIGVKCGAINASYTDIAAEVGYYKHFNVVTGATTYFADADLAVQVGYYNGKATTTASKCNILVDDELVEVYIFNGDPTNAHMWSPVAYDKTTPVEALCGICGAKADLYKPGYAPAGSIAIPTTVAGYACDLVVKTAATTTPVVDGEKVESAETFDAGIAMYVGMSVMAAAGSAVVLKKKD